MSPERIEELGPLQQTLGYQFKNPALLNKALTHKSYVNEKVESLKNNERFEFLGDSVLDLIVSDYLITAFPDYSEGMLSKIRAAVVNEACLAELARRINLGDYLLLGRGESQSGGREKNSLLANAFEALVGAVFQDGRLDEVNRVFMGELKIRIADRVDSGLFQDFKSELQEYTQTHMNCIPAYKVVGETGPDHSKTFEVDVTVQNESKGRGKGKNKKEAEQAAAKEALRNFNSD